MDYGIFGIVWILTNQNVLVMVENSITYNNSMQLFDNGSTLNKICATDILKRAYFRCKEALRNFFVLHFI